MSQNLCEMPGDFYEFTIPCGKRFCGDQCPHSLTATNRCKCWLWRSFVSDWQVSQRFIVLLSFLTAVMTRPQDFGSQSLSQQFCRAYCSMPRDFRTQDFEFPFVLTVLVLQSPKFLQI